MSLIGRRLALAGEPRQRRLIGLKVEGDQTIAAHRHRQLAIDALVATFLQGDPLVYAQCGITAIIDGQRQVGAGAVAIDLVGAHLQTEGKRVATLMIERTGEGDHHPTSQIAALLLHIQFGAQHLHPLATAIQVVTHQGAIIAIFEGKRMAIAGKTRAVEASQGAALIAEHQRIHQQRIGGVFDHKAALAHHGAAVGKGIFGQGNGRDLEAGRIAVHQIDHQRRFHQITVAVSVFEVERQTKGILAVIQTLTPDNAIASVIVEGQGEDGRPTGTGGQGLAINGVAKLHALADEPQSLQCTLVSGEGDLQIAIDASTGIEATGHRDRAIGQPCFR